MYLQTAAPLLSNDQWGLLRALLFIVGPILLGMWAIERRKEKIDITNLGTKVDDFQSATNLEIASLKTGHASLLERQNKDKQDLLEKINQNESKIYDKLSTMSDTLSRLDERWDTVALLKAVIHEGNKKV